MYQNRIIIAAIKWLRMRIASPSKFSNQEFRKKAVILNGNEFRNCQFYECEIIFNGVGSVTLVDSGFHGCTWIFQGPAAETVYFMRDLYKEGGRDICREALKTIAPDFETALLSRQPDAGHQEGG